MVNSRTKGKRGEREFLNELGGWLGDKFLSRNLNQSHEGGADCVEFDFCAIEIKRCETPRFKQWIEQAAAQAVGKFPVLAWRPSFKGWRIWVEMTPAQFADWIRYQQEDET